MIVHDGRDGGVLRAIRAGPMELEGDPAGEEVVVDVLENLGNNEDQDSVRQGVPGARAAQGQRNVQGAGGNKPGLPEGLSDESAEVRLSRRALEQRYTREPIAQALGSCGRQAQRVNKCVKLGWCGAHVKDQFPQGTVVGGRNVHEEEGDGVAVLAGQGQHHAGG